MLAEDLSGQNLAAPVKGGGRFVFLLMLSFKEALKSIKKFLWTNRYRVVVAHGMG